MKQAKGLFLSFAGVALMAVIWGIGVGTVVQTEAAKAHAQEQLAKPAETAAAGITEGELKENLRFFAHEKMGGRLGVGSENFEFPSLFLERELKEYGALPLGNLIAGGQTRGFFQNFTFWGGKEGRNVVGYFPADSDEWVIVGAHYDHVGLGTFGSRTGEGGKLHPGADDNASGTAAVLEIAEALGELRKRGIAPKRNIIVGFWGAEELGCIGSRAFMKFLPSAGPAVKMEKIVAAVNLDMVGRNENAQLSAIGCSWKRELKEASPFLHELVDRVNREQKLEFRINYRDSESQDSFNRSDQESFFEARPAGNRIPVLFFHTGEHPDYHTPADTWDKINYPKLTRVAKLAFHVLWELASSEKTPTYKD